MNLRNTYVIDDDVRLEDRSSGSIVSVQLLGGIDDGMVPHPVDSLWGHMCRRFGEEDAHWDWRYLIDREEAIDDGGFGFSVVLNDRLQGMMLIRPGEGTEGPAMHVGWVGSAPWNRGWIRRSALCREVYDRDGRLPWLSGTGRLLLFTACRVSLDLGFEGRLTLDSLPGAIEFYRSKCHFHLAGIIDEMKSTPMELGSEGARRFLGLAR